MKIFSIHTTDRALTKELQKINNLKKTQLKKIGKWFWTDTFQGRRMNGRNCMKRCSTAVVIRGMQFKTTKRYHFTPTRILKIKKTDNMKYWPGCGTHGLILHYWQEHKRIYITFVLLCFLLFCFTHICTHIYIPVSIKNNSHEFILIFLFYQICWGDIG